MKIKISHTTRYTYPEPVMDSVNELRLTPRTNYRQSCYHHAISIVPNSSVYTYEDYFGNRVHAFSVNQPHRELMIKTHATVVTESMNPRLNRMLPIEDEQQWLTSEQRLNAYAEYVLSTSFTQIEGDVLPFINSLKPLDSSIMEWLKGLAARIKEDFIYDPSATHVQTKVSEIISLRRGVCQDFAHLMIAVCRHHGIPARYVSGYHFVGDLQGGSADFEQATHAWVEAHIPGIGWFGIDPTNESFMNERYVKLGHGRDYKDIVPVKGVYRGMPSQKLEVIVDVSKIED